MIEMFPNPKALADAAASSIARHLQDGLGARGHANLMGTGGSSPGPVYDLLARTTLDWSRVSVTLSDERCVDGDDPASNARLVRERLLTHHAVAAAFLPLWPEPSETALRSVMPFDATILGMGEDGHIASLIPGSPTLAAGLDPDGEQLVVLTPAGLGSPPVARISLTMSALSQSRVIFLLVSGQLKRRVIEQAMAGGDFPVRALLTQDRAPVRVLWSPGHTQA